MMTFISALVIVSLQGSIAPGSMVAPADLSDEDRVPVVGLEGPDSNACPGIGRVSGFVDNKSDVLRVHVKPDEFAATKTELPVSSLIWLCEADGEWQGIVYPADDNQDLGDCRVSSALPEPEPYNGPCQFGWVPAKHINLIAM